MSILLFFESIILILNDEFSEMAFNFKEILEVP